MNHPFAEAYPALITPDTVEDEGDTYARAALNRWRTHTQATTSIPPGTPIPVPNLPPLASRLHSVEDIKHEIHTRAGIDTTTKETP